MDSAVVHFMLRLINILKNDKSLDDETRDDLRKLEDQLEVYKNSLGK